MDEYVNKYGDIELEIMIIMNKILKCITDSKIRFGYLSKLGVTKYISDKAFVEKEYFLNTGEKLDLVHPQKFNEKLQWLKLYDHNPQYTIMVDKYRARQYIKDVIGDQYLIPLLGVWEKPDEIDFDLLPNQFVLKCNHNSGTGMCVCKDKKRIDISKVKRELRKGLREDYYLVHREWPYRDVQRQIIAEKYMVDEGGEVLTDYKFFCFNGEPRVMYISNDGAENPRTDFFDMEFNHLPIKMKDPNSEQLPKKPQNFELMKELAEKLSEGIPFLRTDFYEINGNVYVGELTLYHNAGLSHIEPEEWSYKFGSYIDLSIAYGMYL